VFEYLYEKYKRLMWHKAYTILKDRALAEDITSEAFIRVLRNLHKIDDPDSGKTAAFLVTIVRNLAITQYHREKKSQPADFGEREYDRADNFDMEETVAVKDEAERAAGLLDRLSEELKSVFLLKYAHDLQHKEIAQILGITENNVTVRLFRAKKKLTEWAKGVSQS